MSIHLDRDTRVPVQVRLHPTVECSVVYDAYGLWYINIQNEFKQISTHEDFPKPTKHPILGVRRIEVLLYEVPSSDPSYNDSRLQGTPLQVSCLFGDRYRGELNREADSLQP